MLTALLTLAAIAALAGGAYTLYRKGMTPWALAASIGTLIGAGFWLVYYGPAILHAVWAAITFVSYVLWTVFKGLAFTVGCVTILWGLRQVWRYHGGAMPRFAPFSTQPTCSYQDEQRGHYAAEILPDSHSEPIKR